MTTTLDTLPPEIVAHIYGFLPIAEQKDLSACNRQLRRVFIRCHVPSPYNGPLKETFFQRKIAALTVTTTHFPTLLPAEITDETMARMAQLVGVMLAERAHWALWGTKFCGMYAPGSAGYVLNTLYRLYNPELGHKERFSIDPKRVYQMAGDVLERLKEGDQLRRPFCESIAFDLARMALNALRQDPGRQSLASLFALQQNGVDHYFGYALNLFKKEEAAPSDPKRVIALLCDLFRCENPMHYVRVVVNDRVLQDHRPTNRLALAEHLLRELPEGWVKTLDEEQATALIPQLTSSHPDLAREGLEALDFETLFVACAKRITPDFIDSLSGKTAQRLFYHETLCLVRSGSLTSLPQVEERLPRFTREQRDSLQYEVADKYLRSISDRISLEEQNTHLFEVFKRAPKGSDVYKKALHLQARIFINEKKWEKVRELLPEVDDSKIYNALIEHEIAEKNWKEAFTLCKRSLSLPYNRLYASRFLSKAHEGGASFDELQIHARAVGISGALIDYLLTQRDPDCLAFAEACLLDVKETARAQYAHKIATKKVRSGKSTFFAIRIKDRIAMAMLTSVYNQIKNWPCFYAFIHNGGTERQTYLFSESAWLTPEQAKTLVLPHLSGEEKKELERAIGAI